MIGLRIATRRSALALAQAKRVAARLQECDPEVSVRLIEVSTLGDREQGRPIATLTEVGAFVRSLQRAVIDGEADLAVHSLKDLPVSGPEELVIAALPERASPLDALVGSTLRALPEGAQVGTGSPRRVAQLMGLRPDLRAVELRGNVETRLRKVADGEVDAAVLAEAGLERLGLAHVIAQRLDPSQMVPAPGQGVLAVESRIGSPFAELAGRIDDGPLRVLVATERLLLEETALGCRSALGAHATWQGEQIQLYAFVADGDGSRRTVVTGSTPQSVVNAAREALGL